MSSLFVPVLPSPINYPESDGLPVADNTKQFRWIVVLFGNLAAWYRAVADVFVAGNLFWYPVEGSPEIRAAADVLVIFGRPKGDRRSYRQWEEADVPVTVVFEVLSPSNSVPEMADKLAFHEEHGVEEYYVYDPDTNHLQVYVRQGEVFRRRRPVNGFVSPRLQIRFDLTGAEMVVYLPNGQRFRTYEELQAELEQLQQRAQTLEQHVETLQLNAQTLEQRVETLQLNAENQAQGMTRLRELSRKARLQQASPEELAELERLEEQT